MVTLLEEADGRVEEEPATKTELPAQSEATAFPVRIGEVEEQVANHEVGPEQAQKMLENIRQHERNSRPMNMVEA